MGDTNRTPAGEYTGTTPAPVRNPPPQKGRSATSGLTVSDHIDPDDLTPLDEQRIKMLLSSGKQDFTKHEKALIEAYVEKHATKPGQSWRQKAQPAPPVQPPGSPSLGVQPSMPGLGGGHPSLPTPPLAASAMAMQPDNAPAQTLAPPPDPEEGMGPDPSIGPMSDNSGNEAAPAQALPEAGLDAAAPALEAGPAPMDRYSQEPSVTGDFDPTGGQAVPEEQAATEEQAPQAGLDAPEPAPPPLPPGLDPSLDASQLPLGGSALDSPDPSGAFNMPMGYGLDAKPQIDTSGFSPLVQQGTDEEFPAVTAAREKLKTLEGNLKTALGPGDAQGPLPSADTSVPPPTAPDKIIVSPANKDQPDAQKSTSQADAGLPFRPASRQQTRFDAGLGHVGPERTAGEGDYFSGNPALADAVHNLHKQDIGFPQGQGSSLSMGLTDPGKPAPPPQGKGLTDPAATTGGGGGGSAGGGAGTDLIPGDASAGKSKTELSWLEKQAQKFGSDTPEKRANLGEFLMGFGNSMAHSTDGPLGAIAGGITAGNESRLLNKKTLQEVADKEQIMAWKKEDMDRSRETAAYEREDRKRKLDEAARDPTRQKGGPFEGWTPEAVQRATMIERLKQTGQLPPDKSPADVTEYITSGKWPTHQPDPWGSAAGATP